MSRLLVLIFTLLLPVQFAWSAASAYCQHESAPRSAHFGHHFHAHQGEPKGSAGSQLAPDADCAACHAAQAPAVTSQVDGALFHASSGPTRATSPRPFTSALARAPDRPQWPRLV